MHVPVALRRFAPAVERPQGSNRRPETAAPPYLGCQPQRRGQTSLGIVQAVTRGLPPCHLTTRGGLAVSPRDVVHPGLPGCLLLRSASEREARMNLHRNARLTPRGRRLLVERVCDQQIPLKTAAQAVDQHPHGPKWVAGRCEGLPG